MTVGSRRRELMAWCSAGVRFEGGTEQGEFLEEEISFSSDWHHSRMGLGIKWSGGSEADEEESGGKKALE